MTGKLKQTHFEPSTFLWFGQYWEYGLPIYACASKSNLDELERVQLNAARIISGLRPSCPNDIVLFAPFVMQIYLC
ncbi:hypothetical protein TNCV_4976101 [Trichonephila clavipes]|uniref:Uncharacterized protein n=1 Tax=Trichonephila clavipes TaxID=2585209 RepID=A0A8X6VML2_TRICX|nr:hypothetical protein TNCV_4976101 [Trichonephila clavipes]